jgi:6-phosphogluconate dehydrogenase
MAAYAEGFNILRHANAGTLAREASAETTPFDEAEFYQYELNLPGIAELWRRGSVISSWLLDLTAIALRQSPALAEYSGLCPTRARVVGPSTPPSTRRCRRP